jgi:putative ATP-dependent endonuclease of OLD family
LAELNPATYASLEALGICVLDAGGESQIADLASLYGSLGKRTFALCDKQTEAAKAAIEAKVERLFMHDEKGIEDLILKNTTQAALERFAATLQWPPSLQYPRLNAQVVDALKDYFRSSKGTWGIADFLAQCGENEIPAWLRNTCLTLKVLCDLPPLPPLPPPTPPEEHIDEMLVDPFG